MISYAEIIKTKYPDAIQATFGEGDGNFLLQDRGMGAGLEIVLWDLPDPQPTLEELDQWAKENLGELLKPYISEAIAELQATFYEVAGIITGEPLLDELKIKMWEMRYNLALAWEAAGKPDPASAPAWGLAVNEAANRIDTNDPATLMEMWLQKGTAWNQVLATYIPFEAKQRAAIRSAASVEEIGSIRSGIKAELYRLFGLGVFV